MKISEAIRFVPFYLYNYLTRNKIYKKMNHIDENISDIYDYAIKNVPFYMRNKTFPIINKQIIQDNLNDFISNDYDKDELIKTTTSGSYGTPSTFYRNKDKKINQITDVLIFGRHNNYYFGVKHGFIRGIKKSKKSLFIQNEIHLDPQNLNQKAMEEYYIKLKKVNHIIGFPSVILNFIDFCEKFKLKRLTNISGVTCTAEPLTVEDRDKISKFFNCPVLTRYASEEVGIIANRLPGETFYRVNNVSVKIDIYKFDSDEKQEDGLEGRIIVTDYYSHAMPLINYDTGDTGVMETIIRDGVEIKCLKEITGRLVEHLYDEKDDLISPFAINVLLKDYQKIGQFQFIQLDKAKYRLIVTGEIDNTYKDEIITDLKKILGNNIDLLIEQVYEIPSLKSGKRPYIRNEYKKE
ncbi:hypothetical protein [Jeotgalicoccus sp. S0W5]|uniref:hypothetical protein n=1 Tax=Jeotgalicoccus sp. S0W5 TaxID=2527874 RepID=UPI001415259B|nr:hypothetical protein [Jeotgalicoccus sp. S0W5]